MTEVVGLEEITSLIQCIFLFQSSFRSPFPVNINSQPTETPPTNPQGITPHIGHLVDASHSVSHSGSIKEPFNQLPSPCELQMFKTPGDREVGGGEGVDRVYVCLCACVCVCVCMCFCMHVYVWLWDICFGSGMGNMIQDHK